MLRKPAVAGQFYPAGREHLEKDVKGYLSTGARPKDVIGVVSPHAGYVYSGSVAGAVFAAVNVPELVVVISPNHTGMGEAVAIMTDGGWEIPTGNVPVDSTLASELMKNCDALKADAVAHLAEHSLEVQLPFLLARQPKLKIVPITVSHLRFDLCEKIGVAIATAIKKWPEKILIVASSDMTHYEPDKAAREKDSHAIEKILSLDPRGLLDTCGRERITMCGVVPTAIMLVAARELGAKKGELVKYATSGDSSGDYSSVVGYAGIAVF